MRVILAIFLLGLVACARSRQEPLDLGRAMDRSELVIVGEIRGEAGHERLFAREVIKGILGPDVRFRLGEEIGPVHGSLPHRWEVRASGGVLLFYEQVMGTLSWRLMFYGGKHLYRVDGREIDDGDVIAALRKRANQPPQRNTGSRPSSDDPSVSGTPSSLGPRG